ncbi:MULTISPECIES: helix-turn-helix transcriptional regulator [unclassified Streptomyces]|uniref:helix-turn-helix domain-containing protein n=1 Tax=unclassified Streptomyces TaxID=2593676 RepID=UPI002ECFE5FF|nr:helix-turn-helix domain-containing protein [Streptomyces sp. NBC_00891]WSY05619.1 helix-turn-helix domain-containing protein [Streptomyces sp. NBC_00890]WSZ07243.1 helix-turn-helix domain-containing protein [Streptomyces sp. NBC_00869]WSZ25258.1 helix-turn-helix domain-containing protein [Streptomyces sp. NBC_00870]
MAGSPTARRRRLAIELKKLREESGLTCNAVGSELDWSGSKVNRLETGLGRVQPSDVDALCRFYETSAELRELLKSFAKESKTKGWWHGHGDAVPAWFSVYVGLEQAASDLRSYQSEFIPGLLQTPEYATELSRASADQSDEEIASLVEVRMRRQQLLTATPSPDLWAVIHEGALRHVIGDRSTMVQQIERLLDSASSRNVTVQILPFDAGSYPATGPFTILGFPEQEDPDVVYREGLTDSVYIENAADVSMYNKAFDLLRALALGPERSASLMRDILKEHDR